MGAPPYGMGCPMPSCPFPPTRVMSALHRHVANLHVAVGETPPREWLGALGRWVCGPCKALGVARRPCPGCGERDGEEPRVHFPELPQMGDITATYALVWEFDVLPGTSLREVMMSRRPTLRHIPKSVRVEVADVLTSALLGFIRTQGAEAVRDLMAFPKVILAPLPRAGADRPAHLEHVIM